MRTATVEPLGCGREYRGQVVSPEVHSDEAVRLLRDDYLLFAPDLIWAEFGNVLWKKWRRREIQADVARRIMEDFLRFPLEVRSSDTLLPTAWTIAEEFHRTMYDSLYLALAESQGYRLVTADQRFYNSLKESRLGPMLLRVEDLPS
ncbi:MAG: type II toxin-antitoxin system VapC family toxin [Gammaproteobacteria bacterium]